MEQEFKNNIIDILYIEHRDHFAKYAELYGEERAQGYKDALFHMLQDFDDMIPCRHGLDIRYGRPVDIKSSLANYLGEKTALLNELNIASKPRFFYK